MDRPLSTHGRHPESPLSAGRSPALRSSVGLTGRRDQIDKLRILFFWSSLAVCEIRGRRWLCRSSDFTGTKRILGRVGRLADRVRIGRVGLASLHVWLEAGGISHTVRFKAASVRARDRSGHRPPCLSGCASAGRGQFANSGYAAGSGASLRPALISKVSGPVPASAAGSARPSPYWSAPAARRQQVTPRAHLLALRRAGVLRQAPFAVRRIPGPHASRTRVTIPSGCWVGTGGMACADDATTSAKATANNLIIVTLPLKSPKTDLLF